MLKKFLSIAISAIAVSCIVGCSDQSPVSVKESNDTPEKSAAFYDGYMQDISGYGTAVWAVSNNDPAYSNGDYYLYYYRTNTSSWERTDHWGIGVAMAANGRCYHYNSENAIWCCKMKISGDSSGYVTTISGPKKIKDIGAGCTASGIDVIWILMDDGEVKEGFVTATGVWSGWQTVTQPTIFTSINCIAADPLNGNTVYICHTSPTSGIANLWGNVWQTILTCYEPNDVAARGNNLFYLNGSFLYRRYSTNDPVLLAGDSGWFGLSADNSKVMYLGRTGMPGYIYY